MSLNAVVFRRSDYTEARKLIFAGRGEEDVLGEKGTDSRWATCNGCNSSVFC